MTEWRAVVFYEDVYEVSEFGQLRALPRLVRSVSPSGREFMRPLKGGALRPCVDRNGYPYLYLYKEGRARRWFVHHLVLWAFVGPRPRGYQGCHNDGDVNNIHFSNLRWDTPKNNHADMRRHGTHREGERINFAKLSAAQVAAIRADNRIHRVVAAEYGVARQTVGAIKQRVNWKHVEG